MIQRTPEWHEWRLQGIGASEAAAVLHISQYRSANDVLNEKVGLTQPQPPNEHMLRGIALEDEARSKVSSLLGEPLEPCELVHPIYPYIRASLDGMPPDKLFVVEIKCPTEHNYRRLLKSDLLPEEHYYQMQHQMLVAGVDFGYYFAYVRPEKEAVETGGEPEAPLCHLVQVERDESVHAEMLVEYAKFWRRVEQTRRFYEDCFHSGGQSQPRQESPPPAGPVPRRQRAKNKKIS